MRLRRSDPTKVDVALFYEFARTILQDIDSLENEIKRIKKQIEVKR